jgi:hypothetical protein
MLTLLWLALAAAPVERGNLVLDGLPELPKELSTRVNQYNNTRGAAFADWLSDDSGMLMTTRFGDTVQVHRIVAPLGRREQLTFYTEPVTVALVEPKNPAGFYLRMDQGGSERYQIHWFDLETGTDVLLSDGKARNESLVVAPSGGRIAYASTERNGTDFDIIVMDPRAPAARRRAYTGTGKWSPLGFSADGNTLLLEKYVSINESYLHVLDVTSGTLAAVHGEGATKVGNPAAVLSPDGRFVYFSSDEDSE